VDIPLAKLLFAEKYKLNCDAREHLLRNTDPPACQCFKKKHLTISIPITNKSNRPTAHLLVIASRHGIFQILAAEVSGRFIFYCLLVQLRPSPPLPNPQAKNLYAALAIRSSTSFYQCVLYKKYVQGDVSDFSHAN
jgi:hypothetical protein